jgi:hypothetical protein
VLVRHESCMLRKRSRTSKHPERKKCWLMTLHKSLVGCETSPRSDRQHKAWDG